MKRLALVLLVALALPANAPAMTADEQAAYDQLATRVASLEETNETLREQLAAAKKKGGWAYAEKLKRKVRQLQAKVNRMKYQNMTPDQLWDLAGSVAIYIDATCGANGESYSMDEYRSFNHSWVKVTSGASDCDT